MPDLDIRSFFDKVGHDHPERFIRHRIGDERIVRLILKWLRAGVMEAHGDVIVVRYADDAVQGFQLQTEAERFLADLRERLRKFGIDLNSEKTRLMEFARYATERRAERGKGKPETFHFLGFTHTRVRCEIQKSAAATPLRSR